MNHYTANDLRAAYHQLAEEVSRAVNIPLRAGDLPGGIPAVRARVVEFQQFIRIRDRVLLNVVERETLHENIALWLRLIDDPPAHTRDPPDENPRQAPWKRVTRGRGRPRIEIDPNLLEAALNRRSLVTIAQNVRCCARTVRRRVLDNHLADQQPPVFVDRPLLGPDGQLLIHQHGVERHRQRMRNPLCRRTFLGRPRISNYDLDRIVASVLVTFPSFGRRLVTGALRRHFVSLALRRRMVRPSQKQIRDSIRRVTGRTRVFRKRAVQRKTYRVAGPNSLWHHDGQHGLIRWKIVIHAFIDGYSRFVAGIRASNNNRAATVLDVFREACFRHDCHPKRCRGDCGWENVAVAEWFSRVVGPNTYIWGRSVDNIRIERLWVDVVRGVVDKWYSFFAALEWHDGLDPALPSHIWLLHYLFLDIINAELEEWAESWNLHPMDIARNKRDLSARTAECPTDMFQWGHAVRGSRGYDLDLNAVLGDDPEHLDEYGIDWEALDEHDILRSNILNNDGANGPVHFGPNRPTRFSRIDVNPPSCPLTPAGLQALADHLNGHPDLDRHTADPRLRRMWWVAALHFLSECERHAHAPGA